MKIQDKKNLRHLSLDEIKKMFVELDEKPFRAQQVWEWIWQKGALSIDDMTNLSKELRTKLKENFDLYSIAVDTIQKSSDGVQKIRFKTYDNNFIELNNLIKNFVVSEVSFSVHKAGCTKRTGERTTNL